MKERKLLHKLLLQMLRLPISQRISIWVTLKTISNLLRRKMILKRHWKILKKQFLKEEILLGSMNDTWVTKMMDVAINAIKEFAAPQTDMGYLWIFLKVCIGVYSSLEWWQPELIWFTITKSRTQLPFQLLEIFPLNYLSTEKLNNHCKFW